MNSHSVNSGQLALGVHLRDDATFENFFFGGANVALEQALSQQLESGGEQIIYLHGADGSGRSHLLQAACHFADSVGKSSLYLPMADIASMPASEVLESVENLTLVCIDDLDHITGSGEWEEALFYLINRVRALGNKLLFSASNVPGSIAVELADLHSRLAWGLTFQVHALSDDEQKQALQMRASGRGLILSDEVASYILSRSARGLGSLLALLETLDRASLEEQRKLSIPFVRQYLDGSVNRI